MKQPCVYIVTNKKVERFNTGVTSDLVKRIWQHKNKVIDGFTKKYNLNILVWYEIHESMEQAITKEKQIKEWQRKCKLALIENINPNWHDLYKHILGLDTDLRRYDETAITVIPSKDGIL